MYKALYAYALTLTVYNATIYVCSTYRSRGRCNFKHGAYFRVRTSLRKGGVEPNLEGFSLQQDLSVFSFTPCTESFALLNALMEIIKERMKVVTVASAKTVLPPSPLLVIE